jgi:hypothetical protein
MEYLPSWKQTNLRNGVETFNSHKIVVYNQSLHTFGGLGSNPNCKVEIDISIFSLISFVFYSPVSLYLFVSRETGVSFVQKPPLTKRYLHTATQFTSHVLVFGGKDFSIRVNDLYDYSFDDKSCSLVKLSGNTAPPPRDSHSAISFEGSLVVFGGISDDHRIFDDIYQFTIRLYFFFRS